MLRTEEHLYPEFGKNKAELSGGLHRSARKRSQLPANKVVALLIVQVVDVFFESSQARS